MSSIFRKTGLIQTLIGSIFLSFALVAQALPDAAFNPAFDSFKRAGAGDKSAIEPSAEAFHKLRMTEPGNPVLLAYEGAATAMRAGTTMLPWRKMSYAEDGLAMIDKSLAMLTPAHDAPLQRGVSGSLEVRYVAANTFLAVPGFMNRADRGEKLMSEILASPLFATAPPGFQGTVWMRAAKLAQDQKKPDDAKRYLNLVVSSNAPQSAEATRMLGELAR